MSLETHVHRANYQAFILFLNVPIPVWLISWILNDYGSSILSGLVVKLYNRDILKYCVMILLVVKIVEYFTKQEH